MIARGAALAALAAEPFDVVVIGGGITGAGVALDAASRGFSVALVEAADFASGTSSRSSKLVHGGLRYLEHLELGLVREALAERRLMARLAPHLVRPLPFVVPVFGGERRDRKLGVALTLYDLMAATTGRRGGGGGAWAPARHRVVGGDEVVRLLPALAGRAPTSGSVFEDCQTDDSRLVLTALDEAERRGAVCANRVRAVGLTTRDGRATGVQVRDERGGATFKLRAANVVNATGVWADRLGDGAPAQRNGLPRIRPSRGAHLVFARKRLPLDAGAIVPVGDGRSIFAVPWLGATLVGTTDVDHDAGAGLAHVRPTEADVDYLLEAAGAFFATALSRDDVAGAFAGVRPLIAGEDGRRSVDLSRRAELFETSGGLLTITGGKLTTWRRMARLAVDRIAARDGRDAPCRTQTIALGRPVDAATLPRVAGVPEAAYARLAARYGVGAHAVLDIAAADAELARPIVDGDPAGPPDLLAEAVHAARAEQASSVGDVLLRRTRTALLAARAATTPEVAGAVAAAMAPELGWDAAATARAADDWLTEAAAEGIVVSARERAVRVTP